MLIPSANDAANVLAEHTSGSISAFAELMNKKAKEIGLTSSNFTNPSGIHDENLYTTARDLSLLAKYAMNNKKFMEIVGTKNYTLPATSIHIAEDRTFYTSNLLLDPGNPDYYYKYATGLKTGFTSPAGDCIVASSKKDSIEFIAVCLHSNSLENGLREKFIDCKTLFDFAFDNYTVYYKNLQEGNINENVQNSINLPKIDLSNNTVPQEENYFDSLKFLLKIFAVLIILFAMKILFFGKKKKIYKKRKRKNKK